MEGTGRERGTRGKGELESSAVWGELSRVLGVAEKRGLLGLLGLEDSTE